MDIEITSKAVFALPITRAHLDALHILSRRHYDFRCRMATDTKGFITWWFRLLANEECLVKHRAENPAEFDGFDAEDADRVFTINASSEEIGITLKILESTSIAATCKMLDDTAADLCRDLSRSLRGAAHLANDKYREWQTTYTTPTRAAIFD